MTSKPAMSDAAAPAPIAFTIAGSDPSGGAGLQADLKTFHHFGVYGMSVVTLLTVQDTRGVHEVRVLDESFVAAQIEAVITDLPPRAAKTGALGSAAIIGCVADAAPDWPFSLVVDPVMISKHGHRLIDLDAERTLRDRLLPRATLITPNLHEAEALLGRPVRTIEAMEAAAGALADLGPRGVLIKGGAMEGETSVDVLRWDGQMMTLTSPRETTTHTHGSGCAFAAAITARLAHGDAVPDAVRHAKSFITEAIRTAPNIGHGRGPLNLFADSPDR